MTEIPPDLAAALESRYALERPIGAGGMATVYRAIDRKHQRAVALKVLHTELAHALGTERFRREISLAARLQHPRILTVFDSGEDAGRLWFTMPFIEGETLRALLDREGALPVDRAVTLARDIADALAYAHAHGVVHRDIKPENILLLQGHALVTDFGIARSDADIPAFVETAPARLTEVGTSIGTPAYMSPEQALGEPVVAPQTDQYSLACVTFEMLTGRPPFEGGSAMDVLARRLTEVPPAASSRRPGLPPGLDAVLARALDRSPHARFSSMQEFADALAPTPTPLASTATMALPAAAPVIQTTRRRWASRTAAMGAVVIAGLAAGTWWAVHRAPVLPAERQTLVVADFTSPAGDPTLGATAAEAVRTDLSQARTLTVLTRESMRDQLALMNHATDSTVGRDVANEMAVRIGAKAILEGQISRIGSGYVVSARLVTPSARDELAAFRETASSDDALIEALGKLSRAVRTQGGESLRSVQQSPPLERVTTGSLPALRRYVDALAVARERGDIAGGIKLLEEAVAIDSTFAMAWRNLAVQLENLGVDRPRQMIALENGYRYRERLSDAERALMEGLYFARGPHPNAQRVIDAHLQAAALDSNIGPAWYNAAAVYELHRDWSRAAALYRRVTRVPRTYGLSFSDAMRMDLRLGRIAAMDSVWAYYAKRLPDNADRWHADVLRPIARNDWAAADSVLRVAYQRSTIPSVRVAIARRLSDVQSLRGRPRDAWYWWTRARSGETADAATPQQRVANGIDSALFLARMDGRVADARTVLAQTLRRTAMSALPQYDRPWLALSAAAAAAKDPALATQARDGYLRDLLVLDYEPDGTRALLNANIAIATDNHEQAIAQLLEADRRWAVDDQYAMVHIARAHDAAGRPDSAMVWYARYLATRNGESAEDRFERPAALERLAVLYGQRGTPQRAIPVWTEFLALWANAEPVMQPRVVAARTALTVTGSRR